MIRLFYISPAIYASYASIERLLGEAMSWVWPLFNNTIMKTLSTTAFACSAVVSA